MVGLPVLDSSVTVTLPIKNLVANTTYYIIPVTPTSFGLSTTSTGALAGFNALPTISSTTGTFILLTSSNTKTLADSFKLVASS